MRGRRLRLRLAGGFALERRFAGQFAVGRSPASGRRYDAVLDPQRGRRHGELRGCGLDEDRARLGAGGTQGRPGVLDGAAAGSHSLVGSGRGVARDHRHPGEIDVELIRHDLRERRHDALSDLHLAGEGGDAAVGVDAQPSVEIAIGLQAPRKLRSHRRRTLREGAGERSERETHRERRSPPEEPAPRDRSGAHGDISFAARWMARMIRPWVPQRQRFPASARRMSASLGCGFSSSRPFAVMSMPAMQ